MTMQTNGQALSELPMLREKSPRHTIVETQRGEDFDTGGYELVCDGRVVARGSMQEIMIALGDRGARRAGTVIGMQSKNGRRTAFKILTAAERAAGVSPIVSAIVQEH